MLLTRIGLGSIAATNRSVVRSARPIPSGVPPALEREVEDGQAGDDRPGQVGHRLDPLPADHVGVEPGPAVVLAQLADDQDVDLVERQAGHQGPGLVEQPGLDVEQLLGLDPDDPRRPLLGVLQEGDPQGDGGVGQQESPDLGQQLPEARQAELVDLLGPWLLAQADGEHLEQAALVPAR